MALHNGPAEVVGRFQLAEDGQVGAEVFQPGAELVPAAIRQSPLALRQGGLGLAIVPGAQCFLGRGHERGEGVGVPGDALGLPHGRDRAAQEE